jgi:predicted glutamine amidotransferase
LGTTDSEQAFHALIDTIESYVHQSEFRGLYLAVKYGIKRLFEKYSRYITFHFLLSDGSVLNAFNHNPDAPLYLSRREKDYGDAIVISTEKLQSRDFTGWKKIPKDKVVLISDGRVLVVSDRIT